jgi:hypothetical protein
VICLHWRRFKKCGFEILILQGDYDLFAAGVEFRGAEASVPNGAGWAIPAVVYDQVTAGSGSNFEINYLDPSFDIPSEWKFAIGATYEFENQPGLEYSLTELIRFEVETGISQSADLTYAIERN